jgi:hypothetical protein
LINTIQVILISKNLRATSTIAISKRKKQTLWAKELDKPRESISMISKCKKWRTTIRSSITSHFHQRRKRTSRRTRRKTRKGIRKTGMMADKTQTRTIARTMKRRTMTATSCKPSSRDSMTT